MSTRTGVKGQQGITQDADGLAQALIGWRSSRNLTQDDLAEKSGVSKSAISQIERNANNTIPRRLTLSRLANALGISVEELFTHPFQDRIDYVKQFFAPRSKDAGSAEDLDMVFAERWEGAGPETPAFIHLPLAVLERKIPEQTFENLKCLSITDNTMADTLSPGDVAMIMPGAPVAAGIYVLGVDAKTYVIRRITPQIEPGAVRVSCDNPRLANEDSITRLDRLFPLARVVYVVRGIAVH